MWGEGGKRGIEIREIDVSEQETAVERARLHAGDSRAAERIQHQLAGRSALRDQGPHHRAGLHRRSRDTSPRRHEDIRDPEIVERALALLEEEDPLARRPIVVPGAAPDAPAVQGGLRPDDLLPVHQPAGAFARPVGQPRGADLLLLLDHVGGDLVAEEIEMPVGPQHAIRLAQKLRQALVGDRGEPVRGQPRGGAARPVDL